MRTVATLLILCGLLLRLAPGAAAAESTFRVGALLSLTGDCAAVGEMTRRGIELAIEEINAQGGILGRRVSMVIEDTAESNTANAVTAYRRLLLNPDIHYLIGPSCSPAGLAIAPLAAANPEIVLASPSIGLREFNEAGENIFKLWPYDEDGPKLIAAYAIDRGWRKAAIFSSQQAWEEAQGKWIEREFERLGGDVVLKVEPLPSDSNLAPEAMKLAAAKPEVIFLSNYIHFDVAAVQLAKAGYAGPKVSTLMSLDKIKLANGALEGTVSYGYPPASGKFIERFAARYGAPPSDVGADTGYDIMRLYAKVINEAGSHDPRLACKNLLRISAYPGASGTLSFDKKGGVTKKPSLFIVSGETLSPLQ